MYEYFNTRSMEDGIVSVLVSKQGGGTVGVAYEGFWEGLYVDSQGNPKGFYDLYTGTPKTHEEVVDIALDFLGKND